MEQNKSYKDQLIAIMTNELYNKQREVDEIKQLIKVVKDSDNPSAIAVSTGKQNVSYRTDFRTTPIQEDSRMAKFKKTPRKYTRKESVQTNGKYTLRFKGLSGDIMDILKKANKPLTNNEICDEYVRVKELKLSHFDKQALNRSVSSITNGYSAPGGYLEKAKEGRTSIYLVK